MARWEAVFVVVAAAVCAFNEPPATMSATRKYQNPTRIFMTSFRGDDVSYENTGRSRVALWTDLRRLRETIFSPLR